MKNDQPRIIVTESDLDRLRRLLDHQVGRDSETVDMLEAELARAEVVSSEAVPPTVVTMNSTVVFEDAASGDRRELTLVYPQDASANTGRVSILAPIGSALLGLSVGQSIDWPLPNGRTKKLRIVEVKYQPEASGPFTL